MCHIDGHVAKQGHAAFIRIAVQCRPLGEKQVLLKTDLLGQYGKVIPDWLRLLPVTQCLGPLVPGAVVLLLPDSLVQ